MPKHAWPWVILIGLEYDRNDVKVVHHAPFITSLSCPIFHQSGSASVQGPKCQFKDPVIDILFRDPVVNILEEYAVGFEQHDQCLSSSSTKILITLIPTDSSPSSRWFTNHRHQEIACVETFLYLGANGNTAMSLHQVSVLWNMTAWSFQVPTVSHYNIIGASKT